MANIVVTEDNTTIYVGDGDVVKIQIPDGGTVTIKTDPNDTVDNFKIHFIGDDHSDTVKIDLITFSENDLDIAIHHYDETDEIQLLGGFNKGVDPNEEDKFTFNYIGATGGTFNGQIHAQDGGESDFTSDPKPIVICFAEGTIIDTDLGPRPVETLREGDLVRTQDNDLQPVRWIGRKRLDSLDLARHPELCPVRVRQGALGNGAPYVDLRLSPQHRVQVSDWRAELLFAERSVLVAIKHLVNDHDITVERDVASVSYFHLLFDAHEIVFANGAPAESLHPGAVAMEAVGPEARQEIELLFPDMPEPGRTRRTAQPVLKSYEAEAVLAYAS